MPGAFARAIASQLAEPSGLVGRLLGTVMDAANRAPIRHAIDLLAPQPGEVILDAGCGTGAAIAEVLRRAPCRMVGVDRSMTMIRRAEARITKKGWSELVDLHVAALETLPVAAGSVDAVLALNILYFCGPDAAMVQSLRRALRPGGRLIAYVTHRRSMKHWGFTRAGRHRLYDEAGLRALLTAGGFAPAAIRIETRPVARHVTGLFADATA